MPAVGPWHVSESPAKFDITRSDRKLDGSRKSLLSPKGVGFVCSVRLRPNLIVKITSQRLEPVAKVRESHKQLTGANTCYTTGDVFITVTFSKPKGSFVSTSA
ncbi:hypothetical protein GWN42_15055 [candidate division KSB1 bacterium]|nr:hypothetical protein [candidate division KSB1 bacterium]